MSYRLNLRRKSFQELDEELGGINGDALAHTHERIQRRMRKGKEISRRIERIYQNISQ